MRTAPVTSPKSIIYEPLGDRRNRVNLRRPKEKVILIGGGGHARSLIAAMLESGIKPYGILDPALSEGSGILGIPVLGGDTELDATGIKGWSALIAVGSIRNNSARKKLYNMLRKKGFKMFSFVSAKSIVAGDVEIGDGSVVLRGAVINTGTEIGPNCIVNTGAVIDHDVKVGAHVHICPGAVVCGGVRIGDGAFIGAGSTLIQAVTIGRDAVVGAGSVVKKNIGEGAVITGCPARAKARPSS